MSLDSPSININEVIDERDQDFLENIKYPAVDEIAVEGFVKAVVHDNVTVFSDAYREVKGWFLGIESKRKYVEEICDDLISWLKESQQDEPNLDLDMGSFKTWMKTSENFYWRYYFLLHDETWNKMETDLKRDYITKLETLYDVNLTDRKEVTDHMDSARTIKDLITVVELYKKRSNIFFGLIIKRQIKIKMAPFQVILLGATDLRRTVKKIVNLAT